MSFNTLNDKWHYVIYPLTTLPKGVQNCGETSDAVLSRDSATEEKTGGRAGGSRDEDVEVLSGSDQDG